MKIFYYVGVSPSPTQFEEIGTVYPGFAIIVATGPQNPMLNQSGANLVLQMFIDLLDDVVTVTDEQYQNTCYTF